MFLTVLLLLTNIISIFANWNLIFNEDFNSDKLDLNKWGIAYQDSLLCDPQNSGRLNCYTNKSENIRLINGTLALTALYEKHLNKDFTSGWIYTKQSFTYGKFEIRAALPKGNILKPTIYLHRNPSKKLHDTWREILVMTYYQTHSIWQVIHGKTKYLPQEVPFNSFLKDEILEHFNTYVVEWTEFEVIWKFNGRETYRYDLSTNQESFNTSLYLQLYMSVLPHNVEDVYMWECSLFIIDYVKIYEWSDRKTTIRADTNNRMHSSCSANICRNVMQKIRPSKPLNSQSRINLILVITVSCLLFCVLIIIYFVIRMKKIKENTRREDSYDDNQLNAIEGDKHNDEYDTTYMDLTDVNTYSCDPQKCEEKSEYVYVRHDSEPKDNEIYLNMNTEVNTTSMIE